MSNISDTSEAEELVAAEAPTLDLAELRDLLKLLTDFKVAGFAMGNMSIAFRAAEDEAAAEVVRTEAQATTLDAHETRHTRVSGFWDPSLWPSTNGRPIDFTGGLR